MRSRGRSTPSNAAISSAVLRESRFRQVIVDPRTNEEAAAVVEQFRTQGYEPEGLTLYAYAGVQVWAQAVEKAGTVEHKAVAEALRTHQFHTGLGTVGFDEKGAVYGYEPFVW